MLYVLLGIVGIICYFKFSTIITIICAVILFRSQVILVKNKIQYNLATIYFFSFIGLVVALSYNISIIPTIAVAICFEEIIMDFIVPICAYIGSLIISKIKNTYK